MSFKLRKNFLTRYISGVRKRKVSNTSCTQVFLPSYQTPATHFTHLWIEQVDKRIPNPGTLSFHPIPYLKFHFPEIQIIPPFFSLFPLYFLTFTFYFLLFTFYLSKPFTSSTDTLSPSRSPSVPANIYLPDFHMLPKKIRHTSVHRGYFPAPPSPQDHSPSIPFSPRSTPG